MNSSEREKWFEKLKEFCDDSTEGLPPKKRLDVIGQYQSDMAHVIEFYVGVARRARAAKPTKGGA